MDDSFKNLIDSASSILILLPIDPRLDEVASGLALSLSLKGIKDTSVSCPSQMTVEFSRLVGVNNITSEFGNKNLIMTFLDYPANDIEKVSYDIENEQFKLTVVPKNGMQAPRNDQIQISHAGGSFDLVIAIGGEKEEHFPIFANPNLKNAKMCHLGISIMETKNISVMSFARPASSVSEIIARLIKDNEWKINSDIAANLLAGIENGSLGFQRKETTAETFTLFAELLNMGGVRLPKINPQKFPQGSIPQQPYIQQVQPVTNQVAMETPIPQSWTEPKVYTGTSVS